MNQGTFYPIIFCRDQREGSPKQDSGKSEQDLSEVDLDSPADGTKMESEDSLLNVDVGCDSPTAAKGKSAAQKKAAAAAAAAKEAEAASKKAKRKNRKEADVPTPKRPRYSSGRGTRNMGKFKFVFITSIKVKIEYTSRCRQ